MKKLLTLALVGAMLTATGITAFAETTNVSYDVQPTYTVTIPATVDLGDNDVNANIEASDVLLETGKQIKVDLTAASNTASGSTFNAKNGDSAVTYTITGDKAIAVGDTVATFTTNGSKTLTFSAANKSAATVAGSHTETLTFTVSVTDAEVPVTSVSIDNKAALQSTNFVVGQEIQLTATVTPDNATDKTVTWSKQGMISVDPNGKVTFTGIGYAIINVTAGGASDSVTLRADPKTINIEPNNPNDPIKP